MKGSRIFRDIGKLSATFLSIGAINYFTLKSIYSDQPTSMLYSYGWNNFGQLGLGHSTNSFVAQQVTALDSQQIVNISGRASVSAAVTKTGKVFTWGKAKFGVLGHQNVGENNLNIPNEVLSLSHLKIKSVSCGNFHMAAITQDGDLYTWGNPEHGKLGHPATNQEIKVSSKQYSTNTTFNKGEAPQKVELKNKIKSAACANQHTVCLTEEGEVFVWGLNKRGSLGVKSTELEVTKPIKVELPERIIKIDVGSDFTIALSDQGQLYAWGSNYFGQLGSPSPLYYESPKVIQGFNVKIADFACGEQFVGAIDTQGRLYTTFLGSGSDGQLGHPNKQDIPTPSVVDFKLPVKALSCGIGHIGIITNTNNLYMFGRGREGQLGRGSEVESASSARVIPQLVETLKNKRVIQVACGGSHTLALVE